MKKLPILSVALLLTALFFTCCAKAQRSNENDPKSSDYRVTATISPASGSNILATDSITITFSDTMADSSLELTGDLASEADTAWMTASVDDDTLTLRPKDLWSEGASRTITVNCKSKLGPAVSPIELVYGITFSTTAEPHIATGSSIAGHEGLVITFGNSIDKGNVALSGDLINNVSTNAVLAWSTVTKADDTLTITPAGSPAIWLSAGTSKTLTVEYQAVGETEPETLSLSYTVVYAVFVNDSGDDAHSGTSRSPKATIPAGITLADSLYTTGEVRVAQGTYSTNWAASTNRITMVEGISLYGGYSTTDWTRNVSSYVTTIQDGSTTSATDIANPNRAIDCGSGVTNTTIIDGFTICAGGGGNTSYATAIFCSYSSPTIRSCIIDGGTTAGTTYGIVNYDNNSTNQTSPMITNNIIRGGTPVSGGNYSYGIYSNGNSYANCTPLIKGNTLIYGGDGANSRAIYNYNTSTAKIKIEGNKIEGGTDNTKSTNTYGIYNLHSSPYIVNNTIYAGKGTTILHGIDIQGTSSPKIYNNTIDGGGTSLPTRSCCIYISGTVNDSVVIENNILTFSITVNNNGWGIYENNTTSDPSSIKNNDVYNVGNAYLYHDNDSGIDMLGISSGNFTQNTDGFGAVLSSPSATGNIKENPNFSSSGDGFHLSSSTSTSVTQGGADLSSDTDFPDDGNSHKIDKDSNFRTSPWSIGSYEY